MELINPQIQKVLLKTTGQPDRYFMYVTTNFIASNYEPDGVSSITGPDSSGLLSIGLKVKRVGVSLPLNKAVVHQVPLVDIDASTILSTQVKVYEGTDLLTSVVIVHQDESEIQVKPDGNMRH